MLTSHGGNVSRQNKTNYNEILIPRVIKVLRTNALLTWVPLCFQVALCQIFQSKVSTDLSGDCRQRYSLLASFARVNERDINDSTEYI